MKKLRLGIYVMIPLICIMLAYIPYQVKLQTYMTFDYSLYSLATVIIYLIISVLLTYYFYCKSFIDLQLLRKIDFIHIVFFSLFYICIYILKIFPINILSFFIEYISLIVLLTGISVSSFILESIKDNYHYRR